MSADSHWQSSHPEIFWTGLAPCEHVVQIYENDQIFLDSLEGFVSGGIKTGDCVIIIATAEHLDELGKRLEENGLDIPALQHTNQYIPLDAKEMLSRFMVKGWPDESLFKQFVIDLLDRGNGRTIRAFGEMVALLWANGNSEATIRLERLWTLFCHSGAFCLFCAYPKSGFTQNANESIKNICSEHSREIDGWTRPVNKILYKNIGMPVE